MKVLTQSLIVSKDRPTEQVIPIAAGRTVSGNKSAQHCHSDIQGKKLFRTKNGTLFIRGKSPLF